MNRAIPTVLVACLALAPLASAAPKFSYDHSDTRTLLTNDPLHFGDFPSALWGGSLRTKKGDADLYLNAIEAIDGPNFDPNISSSFVPGPLDYYQDQNGTLFPGLYNFGQPIPGGVDWSFREIASFDSAWNYGTPAPGVYDFTVRMIGGASPTATNVLASFDLHLEVAERLDVAVAANAATDRQGVTHVDLTVQNGMDRPLAITSSFIFTDPSDASLQGDFDGKWEKTKVGAGKSVTKAHSRWTGTSADGASYGLLGVVGGLHDGDRYYLYAGSGTIQGVPEPASLLVFAGGALALVRRRPKTTKAARPVSVARPSSFWGG